MGNYYFRDNEKILVAGYCPDGEEEFVPKPTEDSILVIGNPPCSPNDLKIDEYWSVSKNRPVQIQKSYETLISEIRYKRDQLMKESDWVTFRALELGIPVRNDWLEYRQALRDITLQSDIENIVWPEKPDQT